jgi:hypothetical protein
LRIRSLCCGSLTGVRVGLRHWRPTVVCARFLRYSWPPLVWFARALTLLIAVRNPKHQEHTTGSHILSVRLPTKTGESCRPVTLARVRFATESPFALKITGAALNAAPTFFRANPRATLLSRIAQTLYADGVRIRASVCSDPAPYLKSGLP